MPDPSTSSPATAPTPEPIAVIGVACRFPGARTPEEFWQVLSRDESTVRPVPASRWNWPALAAQFPAQSSDHRLRHGSFIDDLELFDADFFGLTDAEARRLDPQQRLGLEVAWEALESACLKPADLAGSFTAVIMGVAHFDHAVKLLGERASVDGKTGLLSYECLVANRISHVLNLKGPSYTVNSACASSLHALHAACQSLRAHEFDLALAGGVNANLSVDEKVCSAMAGWLSSDAECRSFGVGGDGFVSGEGCGVVVLKRLADALRDGDPIWGVLRDSVLGHNGTSSSLSWPSGNAQRDLLRRLLARNRLEPADIDTLEAHGTGGPMSDRIEASAFTDVLGTGRGGAAPLHVGCVKSHIGHLESASGMAALVKMLLALRHETLPRIRAWSAPNPMIRTHAGVHFLAADEAWPRRDVPRRAILSNFSFGGANSVLLLEEAPPGTAPHERSSAQDLARRPDEVRWLALRARSSEGLRALREQLHAHVDARGAPLDDDELHTLNVYRAGLRQRAVWIARGTGALSSALGAAAAVATSDFPAPWRDAHRVLALPPATFGCGSAAEIERLRAGPLGARLWSHWAAAAPALARAACEGDADARRPAVHAFWLHTFAHLRIRLHAVLGAQSQAWAGAEPPAWLPWHDGACAGNWQLAPGKPALVFGPVQLADLERGDAPALGFDGEWFGADADLALTHLFARLYAVGEDLRWEALSEGARRPVPAAPFARRWLWLDPQPQAGAIPARSAGTALTP